MVGLAKYYLGEKSSIYNLCKSYSNYFTFSIASNFSRRGGIIYTYCKYFLDANNRIFFSFLIFLWGGWSWVSKPTQFLLCFRDKKQLQSNILKEIKRKKTEKYMTTLRDRISYA